MQEATVWKRHIYSSIAQSVAVGVRSYKNINVSIRAIN